MSVRPRQHTPLNGGAALRRGLINRWGRGSAAPLLLAAVGAWAATTNDLADAKIQGCNLARQLLEERPATNFVQSGVLKIRDAKGHRSEIPVKCKIIVTATNWESIYETLPDTNSPGIRKFTVTHGGLSPNGYELAEGSGTVDIAWSTRNLAGPTTMIPFASSDFWIADLGLEFFHWPGQKILKHEMRRSRPCRVLESTNPDPVTNGYTRVVSWIDNETCGIVQAQAYDARGKLLKEFYPKDVKKVKGQWQVEGMEIDNVQTGSRTRLEFDLKAQ